MLGCQVPGCQGAGCQVPGAGCQGAGGARVPRVPGCRGCWCQGPVRHQWLETAARGTEWESGPHGVERAATPTGRCAVWRCGRNGAGYRDPRNAGRQSGCRGPRGLPAARGTEWESGPHGVERAATPTGRGVIKEWSGKRDSNPRLRPWQGRTLPLSYSRVTGRRAPLEAAHHSSRPAIVPQRPSPNQGNASPQARNASR